MIAVAALGKLFGLDCNLSAVARSLPSSSVNDITYLLCYRVGSGSACRSMYGGYVRWSMGSAEDGTDSLASEVVLVNSEIAQLTWTRSHQPSTGH